MAQSPFSTAKFNRAFVAWWLVWAVLQAGLLYWQGFGWQLALLDSAVFNFFTAAGCLLVSFIMQFYLPRQDRFWYILSLSTAASLVIIFLSKWILSYLFVADTAYILLLKNWLPLRFGVSFLMIGCMAMISVIWYSFQDREETAQRKTDAEALTKEAELIALRHQLQPHFLFNSLNSISALVGSKPEEARKMIQQLSDFLRGTIKKENDKVISLEEELAHLQLYLAIEKVRFGHRLEVVLASSDDAGKMRLPALVLQPVVENAIKFGLYDTTGAVTIKISSVTENNYLIIKVQNPFDAETAQSQKGEGFGLNSVKRRLYLLYARNDLVSTTQDGKLFTTVIKIPQ